MSASSILRIATAGLLLASAALALTTPAARADPRWWWHDLRLTDTRGESITPHLVAPGYASGGAGFGNVFIVWSEVDALEGDLEIYLTATFDGGCTFCVPTRLTDNAVDDTLPRVAVLALPTGYWSFAVAFESADQVVIAWDATSVAYTVPRDQLCDQLAGLGPTIVARDQYARFGQPGSRAEAPDIVSIASSSFGQFHAVWQDSRNGRRDIYHARDLTAAGLGWFMRPEKNLTDEPVEMFEDSAPMLAADLLTDPHPVTGVSTMDRTGITATWLSILPTDEVVIRAHRSTDSGTTFSAQGDIGDGPPRTISDPVPPGQSVGPPVVAAAHTTWSFEQPITAAAAWLGPSGIEVDADARFLDSPTTALPDWQTPDEVTSFGCRPVDDDLTIGLQGFGDTATPGWIAWEDSRFSSSTEIACRAGVLDRSAAPPVDFLRYPIPPMRSFDPVLSTDVQLTHCRFDDATQAFPSNRVVGRAVDVELDGNDMTMHAVWADDRDGNWEIYYKRTDQWVSMNAARLTTGCAPNGDAWIDVEFDLVSTCPEPFAEERMVRYFIYYGTEIGGPFLNAAAPVEIAHDPAAGPTITTRIDGLATGTTYQVIVVPEDEARNVSPADFDPAVDMANPWWPEVAIATPDPCVAVEPCLWRADVTDLLPHAPPRAVVYVAPRTAEDIGLAGPDYQCPIRSGDLEQDANAHDNGVALVLYQINRPIGTVRLERSGRTLRFTF